MEIDTSAPEQHFEDSDDEREYKESQKHQSQTTFTLKTDKVLASGLLVVLQGGLSQTTTKIIKEESWELVGTGNSSYKDEKENEKVDEICNLYLSENIYFLVPETSKFKASYVNQLVQSLVTKNTFSSFLVLDDIY